MKPWVPGAFARLGAPAKPFVPLRLCLTAKAVVPLWLRAEAVLGRRACAGAQGDGNAAVVIIKGGTVQVTWLRGKDMHWRVRGAAGGAARFRGLGF